jgi:hypothetical protein
MSRSSEDVLIAGGICEFASPTVPSESGGAQISPVLARLRRTAPACFRRRQAMRSKPLGGGESVGFLRPPGASSSGGCARGATWPSGSRRPCSTSSRSRRTGTSRCRSSGSTGSRRRPGRPRRRGTRGPGRPRSETRTWDVSWEM